MSGPQYIFLILTAIVTWGSFVESSSAPGYRLTAGRFVLALTLPLLVAALIALLPWSEWSLPAPRPPAPWWAAVLSLLLIPVGILGLITVPPAFVIFIALWVSAATTGETSAFLRSMWRRILKREPR